MGKSLKAQFAESFDEPSFRRFHDEDAQDRSPEAQADAMVRQGLEAAELDLEPDIQERISELLTEHLERMKTDYATQGLMNEDPTAQTEIGLQPTAAMQTLAASLAGELDGSGKDKKKKDHFFHHLMMESINLQLEALDQRLAEIDNRLAKIDDSLDAAHELERLRKAGELDPNNPEHAALMRRAGISRREIEEDPDGAIRGRIRDLEDQRDDLERERIDVVNDIGRLKDRKRDLEAERQVNASELTHVNKQDTSLRDEKVELKDEKTVVEDKKEDVQEEIEIAQDDENRAEAEKETIEDKRERLSEIEERLFSVDSEEEALALMEEHATLTEQVALADAGPSEKKDGLTPTFNESVDPPSPALAATNTPVPASGGPPPPGLAS